MSKEPIEFIRHIHDECLYILSVSKNLSKDEFLDDETLNEHLPEVWKSSEKRQRKFQRILESNGM